MKLGSLIPEVNISCVNLQDSRRLQAIFFCKNGILLFQEYVFSLRENFCYPPILIRKVRNNRPHLLQGGMKV